MENISIVLKDNILIPVEEFSALNRCIQYSRLLTLIQKPIRTQYIIKQRVTEYVFEPEAFLLFKLISENILITWKTELTENLLNYQEIQINDEFFIRPYLTVKS